MGQICSAQLHWIGRSPLAQCRHGLLAPRHVAHDHIAWRPVIDMPPLAAKSLAGAAARVAVLHRWRDDARAYHQAQVEGWQPVVSHGGGSLDPGSLWPMAAAGGGAAPSCTGGGAAPNPATVCKRRGAPCCAIACKRGLTGPSSVAIGGEESSLARPLGYCDDATRRNRGEMSSIFCVTSLLRCNSGTLFVLPIGDGCDMHSVLSIHFFCICDVLLKSVLASNSATFLHYLLSIKLSNRKLITWDLWI
jgi:hypothetical protein